MDANRLAEARTSRRDVTGPLRSVDRVLSAGRSPLSRPEQFLEAHSCFLVGALGRLRAGVAASRGSASAQLVGLVIVAMDDEEG